MARDEVRQIAAELLVDYMEWLGEQSGFWHFGPLSLREWAAVDETRARIQAQLPGKEG